MKKGSMKKIKEKILFIISKYIYIFEFILCLIEASLIFSEIINKTEVGNYRIEMIFAIIANGLLIFLIIFLGIKKHKENIEKIFIIFAIPISILYMIFVLPTFVPDENYHAARAYQISEGQVIVKISENGETNTYVPEDLEKASIGAIEKYSDLYYQIKNKTDYSKQKEVYTATQSSPAILYTFSSIGFFLARTFKVNIVIAMYIARMFNLIFSLILGYYSVKLIPFGKRILIIYMFTPMYFQQQSSISYDCVVNAVTIFFISYSLYLIYRKEKISLIEQLLIYALIIVIAISKYVYIPLIGLLFLLTKNESISKRTKIVIISLSIALAIIFSSSSYIFSSRYVDERTYINEMNIDPTLQLINIIKNPFKIIKIILNSVNEDGIYYIATFFGSSLGWLNIEINHIIIYSFAVIFFVLLFLEEKNIELELKELTLFVLIFTLVTILIIMGLYLGWSPVGGIKL